MENPKETKKRKSKYIYQVYQYIACPPAKEMWQTMQTGKINNTTASKQKTIKSGRKEQAKTGAQQMNPPPGSQEATAAVCATSGLCDHVHQTRQNGIDCIPTEEPLIF